jgi:replicative DNA helicase
MPPKAQKTPKDPFLQKLPPQSIEAEESILSAILLDNSILLDVLEILTPEDFYRTAHQKIFAAINDLFGRAEPVDLVTLANALRDKGQLDEIGGAAHLARLVDTVPSAVHVAHYARIVRDKSCLRRLIAKAGEITQKCYQETGELDRVMDFAESAVFEISENKHRAAFFPLSGIIESNISALEDRQGNRALITGVPTGFSRLDHMTSGLQRSDLIILAARPSMGKTALALNIARNAAFEGNVPVAIFSLEMSKEQLSLRMLCSEARVDSSRVRGGFLNPEDWNHITDAASVLSDAPIFIDDSPDISATSIRTKSRRLKMDKELGLIIIDYLQLMKGSSFIERRDLEISEISRSLKLLAKELNVPVLALSQLNRKLEERSDKRPLLSDLRESGALEQDADVVTFIYRDEVYNKDENNPNKGTAELIVAKQRNGPVGSVPLAFLGAYTRFENLA